ncbi:hypothetical protein GCM10022247_56620 [Allokutzneria multivorans]|uniref:DUF2637 domain-containing protein n=1 Tax=Allokutzneria multivorans TaxID=1142134 RepID=A0ABP7TDS3_9PSEU
MSRSKAEKLLAQANNAAAVRAHQVNPDVIALQVERVRTQVDRLMWTGIVLGLAFTMTNVQHFAAGSAPKFTLTWWAAWLLDPMVSLVLIAVLRAEQITARYQITTGAWVRRAKWFTLTATYVMNTWSAWDEGTWAEVVLHSVPPLVVFVAAEAVTDLRDKITETVHRAYAAAVPAVHGAASGRVHERLRPLVVNTLETVHESSPGTAHDVESGAVHEHPVASSVNTSNPVHEDVEGAVHERLGRSVHERAHEAAEQAEHEPVNACDEAPVNTSATVHDDGSDSVHERPHLHAVNTPAGVHENDEMTVHERPARAARERRAPARKSTATRSPKGTRKVLADYVAAAREHLSADIPVTPAWVREVTGCSRGLSPKVAAALKAEAVA